MQTDTDGAMALATAKLVSAVFRAIERNLKKGQTRQQMFDDANIAESTYYRYRDGDFSPTVETLHRLAQFVDLPFHVGVGGYTSVEANNGGTVSPDLARIAAAMVDLSDEDIEHVVKMVETYGALRRGSPPGSEPEREGSSRAARRKS